MRQVKIFLDDLEHRVKCSDFNSNYLRAHYKKYDILIERTKEPYVNKKWDILVIHDDGDYAYYGYWGKPWHNIMDALEEAIIGSCLNRSK